MVRIDSILSRVALVGLLAALVPACSSDDEKETSSAAGGDQGPELVSSTFTCSEDDFVSPSPLKGPGFQDGKLTGALQDTYLVASTLAWLKDGDAPANRFEELLPPVIAELEAHEGFIGWMAGGSEKCGYRRTVSVWKDEESMMSFVTTGAHVAAMGEGPEIARHTAAIHWSIGASELPVRWEAVREKIGASELFH